MPEEKIRYKVGEKTYAIPKNMEGEFLSTYPDAKQIGVIPTPDVIKYNANGKIYNIPKEKQGEFLEVFPDAVEDIKKKEETQKFISKDIPVPSGTSIGNVVKSNLEPQYITNPDDNYSGNYELVQDYLNQDKSKEYFSNYFQAQTSSNFGSNDATNIVLNSYNKKLLKHDDSDEELSDMQKEFNSGYDKILKATTIPNIERPKPELDYTVDMNNFISNNNELRDFANDYVNDLETPERKTWYLARTNIADERQMFNEKLKILQHGNTKNTTRF